MKGYDVEALMPETEAGVGRCRFTPDTPWFSKLTPRLLSGTFRGFQLLKLKHDKLPSHFACFGFNCNLRHYTGVLASCFDGEQLEVGRCRLTPGCRS